MANPFGSSSRQLVIETYGKKYAQLFTVINQVGQDSTYVPSRLLPSQSITLGSLPICTGLANLIDLSKILSVLLSIDKKILENKRLRYTVGTLSYFHVKQSQKFLEFSRKTLLKSENTR